MNIESGKQQDQWTEEGSDDQPIKQLTRAEAQALVAGWPKLSPWHVLALQALTGLLVTLLTGIVTRSTSYAMSALYGAFTVILPGVVLGWGLRRRANDVSVPGLYSLRFMFWEFVKLGLASAMLVLAARIVPHLHWPALLVSMVVCMKISWLAVIWQNRSKK